jgi:ATP-dependent protease ClpP protease subunit
MRIMPNFWNFIRNQITGTDEEEIELRIEGDIIDNDYAWLYEWFGISATSPNAFREELNQYKGKNITVWIDSYGGSVFAAAGIYNALMEHKKSGAKIKTKVDGKAMSAATIPMMAGDERLMSPMAMFMMHNPLTSASGYASDFRKTADVLDEVKETIVNAYQLSTKRSRSKISSMMDEETYMSARTAIKEGFATGMLYADDGEQKTEDIINLGYGRILAIQNSANETMKKFFELPEVKSRAMQAKAPELQPVANKKINCQEGDNFMSLTTIEELRNECPELLKQIQDAAREEGKKEERIRIQDIEKISNSMNPELVRKAKFEEPTDAKELAFQALQADAKNGQKYLKNAEADAEESGSAQVGSAPNEPNGSEKPKTVEDKVKNMASDFDARRRGMK